MLHAYTDCIIMIIMNHTPAGTLYPERTRSVFVALLLTVDIGYNLCVHGEKESSV